MHISICSNSQWSYELLDGELKQKTLTGLQEAIFRKDGIPIGDQRLYLNGSILNTESQNITDCLYENCSLNVSTSLEGGKVHGSLARAGKVIGQTPKVEKQEKKKQKTGRAKRRMQYNRVFIALANNTGRKRKGPNSNSK